MLRLPPRSTLPSPLFPYTPLFRSGASPHPQKRPQTTRYEGTKSSNALFPVILSTFQKLVCSLSCENQQSVRQSGSTRSRREGDLEGQRQQKVGPHLGGGTTACGCSSSASANCITIQCWRRQGTQISRAFRTEFLFNLVYCTQGTKGIPSRKLCSSVRRPFSRERLRLGESHSAKDCRATPSRLFRHSTTSCSVDMPSPLPLLP